MTHVTYTLESNMLKFVPMINLIGSDNMTSEADNQQPSFISNDKEGSETKVTNSDVSDEYLTIKRIAWNKGLTKETDERVRKNITSMTLTKRRQGETKEVVPWNVGLTKETDERIAKMAALTSMTRSRLFTSGELVQWNKGLTKEENLDVAKNAAGVRKAYIEGRMHNYGQSTRGGYRDDLCHYVRSRWEANVARLLKFLGLTYEYEPKRFNLSDSSYLPDFYVKDLDHYIEVKGY